MFWSVLLSDECIHSPAKRSQRRVSPLVYEFFIAKLIQDLKLSSLPFTVEDNFFSAGLQWYKAIAPPELFGILETPSVPKIDLHVLGIFATKDVFLTKAQMKGSAE
jgi:hypothetical protein